MSTIKPQLNSHFIAFYNESVKPIAEKCAELFPTMRDIENRKPFSETDPNVIKLRALIDGNAPWFIGLMIGDIETAIVNGINLNLINSIGQVNGCLNSESYWTNVWKDDSSSEEAKNLKELAALMPELLNRL